MSNQAYYKFLAPDGAACYGGTGAWPLPVDDQPGEWLPPLLGTLIPCERGYHVLQAENLPGWVKADVILCAVEVTGKVIDDCDKHVTRCARVIEVIGEVTPAVLVQWARDCSEHVSRLIDAANAAHAAAYAARAAAYAANAAHAAAYAARAANAAHAAYAAHAAAYDAAHAAAYAAYDAAYAAAYDAARVAEQRWQGERLIELVRGQRAS